MQTCWSASDTGKNGYANWPLQKLNCSELKSIDAKNNFKYSGNFSFGLIAIAIKNKKEEASIFRHLQPIHRGICLASYLAEVAENSTKIFTIQYYLALAYTKATKTKFLFKITVLDYRMW